jgi:hypothetical protein
MARYPAASWRRLPGDEPKIKPRTVIFHTMVGTLPGVDAYFRSGRSGGIESHFGVGGPWEGVEYDGAVYQWRDTEEQADANLKANAFAISIETSDGGDAGRTWTPKQVDALVALGSWLADTHGIPRRICPAWDQGGFGWHVMFGAPSQWTPVAKTCPGSNRISQLRNIVLPRIFATEQEVDDVTKQEFLDALGEFYRDGVVAGQNTFADTYRVIVDRQTKTLQALTGTPEQEGVMQKLDQLIELLRTPPEPPA